MLAIALLARQTGLTLAEIVAEIPHDAAAVVVYLMFGAFLFFIWYGSRPETVAKHSSAARPEAPLPDLAAEERADVPEAFAESPRPRPTARARARAARSEHRIAWIA